MIDSEKPVLFFDGVCNLCNHAVQFVIRHDRQGKVRFATLQSEIGEEAKKTIIATYGHVPDSLIFFDRGKYYTLSSAALRMAGYLDGGWRVLKVLLIVPPFIRNAVYKLIAAKRYKWFGKLTECMMPTPELRSRFLS